MYGVRFSNTWLKRDRRLASGEWGWAWMVEPNFPFKSEEEAREQARESLAPGCTYQILQLITESVPWPITEDSIDATIGS